MGPSGRFTHVMIYWTVWDRLIQILYLGRAPRTKETLPDFLKWRRVTRHPLVFHRLTGSQQTPGFGVSQVRPDWRIRIEFGVRDHILGLFTCFFFF